MSAIASPLQVATIASALLWPLAAGAGVVIWSRARAAARTRRAAALESQLRSLYRSVEIKPVPPRLAMVLDALEEGEELACGPIAKGKAGQGAAAES